MAAPQFLISDSDRELVSAGRRITHPSEMAPLLPRIPEGAENGSVIAVYNIVIGDPRGMGDCALCHHPGNHRRGAVLGFADGSRASIGRCCVEKSQDVVFAELLTTFDEGSARGHLVRRVELAIGSIETARDYVLSIMDRPTVIQLKTIYEHLQRRFSKLFDELKNSKGVLLIEKEVVDLDDSAARRKRRDKKVDAFTDRFVTKHQRKPTSIEIKAEFAGDADFSLQAKMKKQTQEFGRFVGVSLFTMVGRLEAEVATIASRLEASIQPLDGKVSGEVSTEIMRDCLDDYRKTLAAAVKLVGQVNDAARFFDRGNLGTIVRWANQNPDVRSGETYVLNVRALVRDFGDGRPSLTLDIPEVLPEIDASPISRIAANIKMVREDTRASEAA